VTRRLLLALVACSISRGAVAQAQTLDQEMASLAARISKSLVAQSFKHVAAVDFTDLQGQPTELGRFLSEALAVEIVSAGGVSMVDRANIKSILAEHKLTEEGLVNPANAKKLGEFAGVDAILTGNVTALDDGIVLMVKAVSTSSASIVAAGRIKFPKTSEIQQLLNRGVSSTTTTAGVGPLGPTSNPASYREGDVIATKDAGSLRVVLRSVVPLKVKGDYGRSRNAIRCSFEFINLELHSSLALALNAMAPRQHEGDIAEYLRSSLADERGMEWGLPRSSASGIGIVGVGIRGFSGEAYTAGEIVPLLQRLDETHTPRDASNRNTYIFGSTSAVAPGQSITVTMTFLENADASTRQDNSGPVPKFFELDTEVVVGIVVPGSKTTYSLHNLRFDRVGVPHP
jgi:TolB-like protein